MSFLFLEGTSFKMKGKVYSQDYQKIVKENTRVCILKQTRLRIVTLNENAIKRDEKS